MKARRMLGFASVGLMAVVSSSLFVKLAVAPPAEVVLAGYATDLQSRTIAQRINAGLSARAINDKVIAPGAIFSFDHTVRSWTFDAGYVRAPVSYDGELVLAEGGGVCQTSTTLYNAALLAGLPIVERHAHVFVAHYVPPGHDAAVAIPAIDLRFRNPYPWPIRIQASAAHGRLQVQIWGARPLNETVEVVGNILSTTVPERLARVSHVADATGRAYMRCSGAVGYHVVTYRVFSRNGTQVRSERLSDDTYQAMNRVVQIDE